MKEAMKRIITGLLITCNTWSTVFFKQKHDCSTATEWMLKQNELFGVDQQSKLASVCACATENVSCQIVVVACNIR